MVNELCIKYNREGEHPQHKCKKLWAPSLVGDEVGIRVTDIIQNAVPATEPRSNGVECLVPGLFVFGSFMLTVFRFKKFRSFQKDVQAVQGYSKPL